MKLFLKITVLAVCSFAALRAMDDAADESGLFKEQAAASTTNDLDSDVPAPVSVEGIQLVEPFSQGNVDTFKAFLLKRDQVRFRYQMLLGAVGTGVAAYALYKVGTGIYEWWTDKEEDKYATPVRLAKQREKHRDLVDRLEKLERAYKPALDYSVMPWGQYFWEKTKGFAGGVANFVPQLGGHIATIVLASQAHNISKRILPDIGDSLFEGRTIAWCIETKTALKNCVRDLANWADDLIKFPTGRLNELECLALSMNIFVKEVEKVIAYIAIVQDQLRPELERETKRAAASVALIKRFVADLVRESNSRIKGEEAFERAEFAQFVKRTIAAIISQMEKIEVVQQAVGYENLERINTFDNIRAQLIPEVKKLRAEKEEFGELLAQIREAQAAAAAAAQ